MGAVFVLNIFFVYLYIYSTGPEVGLAWLSQVCTVTATDQGTNGEGYTSGTGVSAISKLLRILNVRWKKVDLTFYDFSSR